MENLKNRIEETLASSWFKDEYCYDGSEAENLLTLNKSNFNQLFLDVAILDKGEIIVFPIVITNEFKSFLNLCCDILSIDFLTIKYL